jgi:cyclophilin family peptidyl-prolyl cis-trans isomerase
MGSVSIAVLARILLMRAISRLAAFLSVVLGMLTIAVLQAQPPEKAKTDDKAKAEPPASATPPATTPPAATTPMPDPNRPAAAEFQKVFEDWKTIIKDLRKLRIQYQSADAAGQKPLEEQWTALVTKGNETIATLRDAALKAFAEGPNEDPQLTGFLVKLASDAADRDEYELARQISDVLIKNNCDDKKIYGPAALAAYSLHDFDKAAEYQKLASEAGVPAKVLADWNVDLAQYKKWWDEEQAIRSAEEAKGDLPRVKITTTKGDIVIELFENEAPDTVGNFISLVEKKFYDNTVFHRVLKNFMAQGGDPEGTGSGGPGYNIYCECEKPNARRHFRGSLSMAHAGKNTGGSQFFLTFLPTAHLNGKHTCFGRVVEGMDVLAKIQRIEPGAENAPTPDKIVKAEVVRKRDHAYAPRKVE